MSELTSDKFILRLAELRPIENRNKADGRKQPEDDRFLGIRMGDVFKLGKEFSAMPVVEVEKLMESPAHMVRVGALSIMGQSAKGRQCTPSRLKELYQLYIRRHDRINTWDLVDLAAYYVVGQYLADKSRKPLYKLARSKDQWERRTAIVATAHFILKMKEVDDTFAIAEILVNDKEESVNKGTGWMVRAAGDVDRKRLLKFLDKYAASMPRVLLRYSIEKLPKDQREHYMKLRKGLGADDRG